MVYRIPTSDRLIFPPKHAGDMVIELSEYPEVDDSVKKSDVPRMGTYEDGNGNTIVVNTTDVYNQGLQRDHAIWIESAGQVNFNELNERGNRISTHVEEDNSITI